MAICPETYIDRNAGRLVRLLKGAIAIDTESEPGNNYRAMAEFFRREMRTAGLRARVLRVSDAETRSHLGTSEFPRYLALGRWSTGAKRTLHFNGHFDVVPCLRSKWDSPPYSPVVRDGWLFGRGASDMKGGIAAFLFALRALRACGLRPGTNVEISCTPDEEIGGELGAGFLCRSGVIRPDYVLIGEGGRRDEVSYGHRGALWLEATVVGKAGHAMDPPTGVNAFERMGLIVAEVKRGMDRLLAEKRRRFTAKDGTVFVPTLTMGGRFGGVDKGIVNTIPEIATFSLDRRITPAETLGAAERELRRLLTAAAKRAKATLEVRTLLRINPYLLSTENALFNTLAGHIRRVNGVDAVRPVICKGFLDLAHFCDHFTIHGCGFGVAERGVHGANEAVELADLVRTAKIYAGLLTDLT